MAHQKVLYSDGKVSIYERTDEKGVWLCEDFIPANISRALCFTELGIVHVTTEIDAADKPLNRYIEPLDAIIECYMFCDSAIPPVREIKLNWLKNFLEG